MPRSIFRIRTCLLGAVALLVSCGDATGPGTRPGSDLNILRIAATAPPLEENEISF
jgi:hypothetical protein